MPAQVSPANSVLEALGFAVFSRDDAGTLRVSGTAPDWLCSLWPAIAENGAVLPIAEASPFLENFLIDAEVCWRAGGSAQAKSGPWIEQDAQGGEVQLEATAMTAAGQPVLLLERLSEEFEAKKSVLQKARETVIAHQRLNSEIQKKEILLHCVADEMTAALANVITSLRLIEAEDNGPRTKLLLGLATRGTQEQQTLINRILDVFEDELRGVFDHGGGTETGADWSAAWHGAIESTAPQFVAKQVALDAPTATADAIRVPSDAAHLERVVANLLENALERTPARDRVVVRCEDEMESVVLYVEDNGPAMSDEACADLFTKLEPTLAGSQAAALRLHFCRIMVENCGGEIGCMQRPGGGHSFWVRLPKLRGPE